MKNELVTNKMSADLSDIMNHSLEVLQFSKVCEIVASYCVTDEGKAECCNRKPFTKIQDIEYEKKLGKDFLNLLDEYNAPPLKYRPPVIPFFEGIEKEGASLAIEGVYSVGLLAKSVCDLKEWAEQKIDLNKNNSDSKNRKSSTKKLNQIAVMPEIENEVIKFVYKKMHPMFDLKEIIFSFIDENGELQDLPTLRAIKKKIKSIENDIDKIMHSYFTNEKTRSMLQSNVPTIKDGRQVIAVMSNFKGRIKGIIHEYSQSRQTFYLEPEEIVEKNNDLFVANAEYERELLRLLQKLTADIAKKLKIIKTNCKLLVQFDCIAAGAKWAHSKKCVYAKQISNSKKTEKIGFFLQQARHPLLGSSAVPIDLKLSKEDRVLIITGPNTGGKTVSLKTAALFAVINQAGWPIPAEEKTALPYFDFIACDIGDEQSLDQSLSTFSAHMKTVSKILKNSTENSFVILDELGSGTDPQEGCAIAMAVLDTLLEKKSFVFVTTHHGALKNYGYSKPSCVNASVEFNHSTLSPTYKIMMGVPGESHAIDIALRNGLDDCVIEKAKDYLGNNRADISDLIKGLIQKHSYLNEFEMQKKEEEIKLKEKIRNADLKKLQLKQKELELKQSGIKKLDVFFEEKRCSLENLVRELREGELSREKTLGVKKWIDDFGKELQEAHNNLKLEQSQLNEELSTRKAKETIFKEENNLGNTIEKGLKVFVKGYNRSGEIIRKDKKGKWLVALDNLKIAISETDLEPCKDQENLKTSKPIIISDSSRPTVRPVFELRLLGMRAEEAEKALQNQMDLALVHNLSEFSIIHGKGNGVLQKLTQDFLKKSSFVKNFCFARPEEGGAGKTMVQLG